MLDVLDGFDQYYKASALSTYYSKQCNESFQHWKKEIFENQTRGRWVRSANATSVLYPYPQTFLSFIRDSLSKEQSLKRALRIIGPDIPHQAQLWGLRAWTSGWRSGRGPSFPEESFSCRGCARSSTWRGHYKVILFYFEGYTLMWEFYHGNQKWAGKVGLMLKTSCSFSNREVMALLVVF